MDDLPADYDAIVVGTGMIESIIAAALSRIGKSVLHLDSNEYYGENWASFNLEGFENWIENCNNVENEKTVNKNFNDLISENEKIIEINPNQDVWNVHLNDFSVKRKVDDEKSESCLTNTEQEIQKEESVEGEDDHLPEPKEENFHKLSRRFNLDLCPKLLFSKGPLVELLITSNIARYAEFKSVSRVLTWREGQLEPVPCSRSDVFATKNVTVVHKRILVKILTLFANYTENLEEFEAFQNKTFLEYLRHKKLPENLIHYILYAIAMGDNTTSCLVGVKNCKAFLESLGRYGNTPFIFPMYGSGELPQCFCRLCAVFGGTYCLQRGIEALIVKNDQCVGVISNRKRLNAKYVVLSSKYAPKDYFLNANTESITRGIFVTNRSILTGGKESLTLLQFPPVSQVSDKTVTVLELGSGTCTCPEGYFIVHMTSEMIKDAYSDLKHVVAALFATESDKDDSKPKILWSGTWNVTNRISKGSDLCIGGLKICNGVDSELDYNFSVSEAKRIFKELYPEEEFLPRAPDPDEIVLDMDETNKNGDDITEKTLCEPNEPSKEITEGGCDSPEQQESQYESSKEAEEMESHDADNPNERKLQ